MTYIYVSNVSLCKAIALVGTCNIIDITPSASIPDNSILSWDILTKFLEQEVYCDCSFDNQDRYYDKFDFSEIPQDFLLDLECLGQVSILIGYLEESIQILDEVDRFYTE